MKANFALSLSFEGIQLLHRAAGGWRRVGEADLASDDLPGALAELRNDALALAPDGLRTKLIIPSDQIKYLSIETGEVAEIDRRIAARKALDGATPYAVEDLAFDVSEDGSQTHVAAVARETLAEAESFAQQHGFDPICSVAVPGEAAFLGEPYFGPTSHADSLLAQDDRVERDGVAVVIVGDVADDAGLTLEEIEDAPNIGDETDLEAVQDTPEQVSEEPDQNAPSPEPEPTPEPDPEFVGFSTRRRAPELGGVTRDGIAPVAEPEVPPIAASVTAAELPAEDPGFSGADAGEPVRARFNPLPETPEDTAPDIPPAPPPIVTAGTPAPAAAGAAIAEKPRMSIFGTANSDIGGKPRFLGLILTAILLIFLVGVAAWARVYFEDEISRLFSPRTDPDHQFVATDDEIAPEPELDELPREGFVRDEDVAAALEAAGADAPLAQPESSFDEAEARTFYARTGIWIIPTKVPQSASRVELDDLYMTSVDTKNFSFDAVVLASVDGFDTDEAPRAIPNPQPPEVTFAFDERGLIIPTPQGAISPDGFRVYAGKPPNFPATIPDRIAEAPVLADDVSLALAATRPRARPDGLVERTERENLGGISRSELARARPQLRPERLAVAVEPAVEPETLDTTSDADIERAVAAALRPEARPNNFQRIVARAAPQETETRVAAVQPRTVQPSIPSRASVAKQATVRNALKLNRINLLGVSGKPSSRRALVRLSNGRIKRVKVGDRIDGGRVSAIGDGELRYQKGSRNIVLKMPKT